VAASAILAATTPVAELLGGLERLRLPKTLTVIAGFMVRYADVIADEVRRMRIARISRGHDPRWIWQARAVAASAGTLFIRSYERGERVYLAMVSRGYTGSMPVLQDLAATRAQWLAALAVPGAAALVAATAWGPGVTAAPGSPKPEVPPALEVDGVAFAYPDGHQALYGVSFSVRRGERVALLGPNGAGKTTLVLQLNGVLLPGAGRAAVAGMPVASGNLREIRRRVGIVFQDPDDQLFMPTVAEDVAFGPANLGLRGAELETRVKGALAAVGMEEHAARPPHHLSFGQRRRVAVATVLAMEPEVLVLDEPSSNLDPASRRELAEIVESLDITTLMVTHDLPYALQLCPRSLILNGGRITADGPTADLLADTELLAANRLELPFGFDPAALRRR